MNIADALLKEEDLIRKFEIMFYLQKKESIFFNTTSMIKAELMRMFLEEQKIPNIDISEMLTMSLIYTVKRIDSPQERQRMKDNKQENMEYIQSLGFSDEFAKNATYYKEGDVPDAERTVEEKILDIFDQFAGLISHREERIAYDIPQALDVLEKTNMASTSNEYLPIFIKYIQEVDESEGAQMGVISDLQKGINALKKEDITNATRLIYDAREKLEGTFEPYKIGEAKESGNAFFFEDK